MEDFAGEARGHLEDVQDRVRTISMDLREDNLAVYRIQTLEGEDLEVTFQAPDAFHVTRGNGQVQDFDCLNAALMNVSPQYGGEFLAAVGAQLFSPPACGWEGEEEAAAPKGEYSDVAGGGWTWNKDKA